MLTQTQTTLDEGIRKERVRKGKKKVEGKTFLDVLANKQEHVTVSL